MQNAKEQVFQQDIIDHLVSNGWTLGESGSYDQKHALHPEDLVGYLSETQPEQWEKFSRMHPDECRTAEQGMSNVEGNAGGGKKLKKAEVALLKSVQGQRGKMPRLR